MSSNNNGKLKRIYIWVTLLIIIFGGIYLFYLIYIDGVYVDIPLTFDSSVLTTDKQQYKNGEALYAKFKFCKHTTVDCEVNWAFIDDLIYNVPTHHGIVEPGCYEKDIFISNIPENLQPGRYHVIGEIKYQINPMQLITYNVSTNNFLIVK